jgi:hypothetical protein
MCFVHFVNSLEIFDLNFYLFNEIPLWLIFENEMLKKDSQNTQNMNGLPFIMMQNKFKLNIFGYFFILLIY